MKKPSAGAAAVLLCLVLIMPMGSAGQDRVTLSLDECLVGALKYNLRIAAEIISPEIADLTVETDGRKVRAVANEILERL